MQKKIAFTCLNADLFSTVPMVYEDKAMEGNCFILSINDEEHTSALCLWG